VTVDSQLESQVKALETMGLEDLRAEWRRRWKWPPPLRSQELLRHIVAWRIQAEALGGLDSETKRFLRRQASIQTPSLRTGQRITREWQGVHHEVEFIDGKFLHNRIAYKSLSEIARVITGTHWNGPRFFGLRETP
jgi:hypothetical protein